jgi:hypothetical protein
MEQPVAIVLGETADLHQITRRVSADGHFWEENELRAAAICLSREIQHLADVTFHIANRRIQLADGNDHEFSCRPKDLSTERDPWSGLATGSNYTCGRSPIPMSLKS